MKKLLFFALAAVLAFFLAKRPPDAPHAESTPPASPVSGIARAARAQDAIADAYANRRSGVEVEGEGTVAKILGDDSLGDRHQRFVLRLPSGQTVLVAHNIDLAPRIEPLAIGATVAFRGEYEWSDRGGTIHWTHHDPRGEHAPGWLRHGGQTYE